MRSTKSLSNHTSSSSSSFNKNNHNFISSSESESEYENNSSNHHHQNQNQNHKKKNLFSIINSFLCIKKFKLLISNFSIVLLLISSSFKVYLIFHFEWDGWLNEIGWDDLLKNQRDFFCFCEGERISFFFHFFSSQTHF